MALFGKKPKADSSAGIYLLMDSGSRMLARGRLKNVPGSENLNIVLIEGGGERLAEAGVIQAVPQDKSLPVQMTRVLNCWNDMVTLEPMRELGAEVRRNFRVPVRFESFVYPKSIRGRAPMTSVDLSCGGVAFYSPFPFRIGDRFEVVLPMTSEGPLLLTAEILRVHLEPDGQNLYACKFVDMIDDEEALAREAVFAIQLDGARARKN